MDEIERIVASDLFENEYLPESRSEKRIALSQSAARRIIKTLTDKGYVIRKKDE